MPRSRPAALPPSLRSLLDAGVALTRRAPSSRVAEARAAALLPTVAWPVAEFDPLDSRTVERALKAAWGRAPSRVLDDLDPEPIAVRPAAQVHRGVAEGDAVAVKVLRPGLTAAVRADLALLDALAPAVGAAFPRLDVPGVLAEMREAALDELDLEHEAQTSRLVGRGLRDLEGLLVPRAHGELSADTVLVTELLDGATLLDGARPADPETAARTLVQACLSAVTRGGVALTDLRPGHVVVAGGRIGLLGAGVSRPWSAGRLDHLLDALEALGDPAGGAAFAAALDDGLGLLDGDAARAAHPVLREVLGELVGGPARLDLEALRSLARRALDHAGELAGLLARATPQPSDLSALRGIGQLVATLAALEVTTDWVAFVVAERP